MILNTIYVRHNMEVAHRLMWLPGKCQAIHGHSMLVTAELEGVLDENGILAGWDFGVIKKEFRKFLDEKFDHHLILNQEDPFATLLESAGLSGLTMVPGDPTTENLTSWILKSCRAAYTWGDLLQSIEISETGTNGASATWIGDAPEVWLEPHA